MYLAIINTISLVLCYDVKMNANELPRASPEPNPELTAFLQPFAPLFRRSTSRKSLERYMTGLLTDLDHKNCDTIAQAVAETSTEQLQYLLTNAQWDALALEEARVRQLTQQTPAGACCCLTIPDCPNKGRLP
jgi:SRSO17 transposase